MVTAPANDRFGSEATVPSGQVGSGFADYRFVHRALPELDLSEVDCTTTLLGRPIAAPILISCIAGATAESARINAALVDAASRLRLPIGLEPGRLMRGRPDVPLLVNLAAVELAAGITVDDCRSLLDQLGADALVLHLDPLREALKPDGNTRFRGLLSRIADLCDRLERPVIVKEMGWGIAPDDVLRLFGAGVHAVDVSATGGTCSSEADPRVTAAFAGWGIPAAEVLRAARAAAPAGLIFASGGLRDGVDVAKAVALGADIVGLATPFIRAAAHGHDRAVPLGEELIETLRIAMFCAGARTLPDLRRTACVTRIDA